MFENNFVVCIKVAGKILREFKDVVNLPFGTEFTILLKNLNTVRAKVSVSIDGTDATEHVYLIVEPNDEFELKRFIKKGNMTSGNAFKFIERTAGIEQHRGIKANDGLVRVEFQFEQIQQTITTWTKSNTRQWPTPDVYNAVGYASEMNFMDTSRFTGSTNATQINCMAQGQGRSISATSALYSAPVVTQSLRSARSAPVSDVGITVPGSVSNQEFKRGSDFAVNPQKHVIILHLVGATNSGEQYIVPVVVQSKPKCQSCGKVNKATSKFCCDCGTGLVIL